MKEEAHPNEQGHVKEKITHVISKIGQFTSAYAVTRKQLRHVITTKIPIGRHTNTTHKWNDTGIEKHKDGKQVMHSE